ncbi:GNAT family N-acetyltransferase [Serpentinimonas barnesii]|uniref:GNAT family N-acetyltransferase n=1 Tax=Serpentinimonas barnesii TaxID=1458427 RepID=UPI0034E25924
MPDPVPVMVLARLAVDHRAQGIKLGAAMLQDAFDRAVSVAHNAGVRALLVHALHDRAKQCYEHYGFQESPQHPMTLMLRLNTVKQQSRSTTPARRKITLLLPQRGALGWPSGKECSDITVSRSRASRCARRASQPKAAPSTEPTRSGGRLRRLGRGQ